MQCINVVTLATFVTLT